MNNVLAPKNTTLTPEQAFPFQKEIDTWNMEKAVQTIAPKVEQLKKISVEVVRELWIAHEALARRGGDRRSEDAQIFGFCNFLELVGISKKTAYMWLKLYDAANDRVLTPEEYSLVNAKSANPAIDNGHEVRVAHAMATGERMDGWTEEDEKEFKTRSANARFAELAKKWGSRKIQLDPKCHDYFSDAMKNAKQYARISLQTKEQTEAQFTIFEQISVYLSTFVDPSTRLSAAYNVGLRVRDIVNELANTEAELAQFDSEESKTGA